jgi:plasmid stabilization system protein ParE
MPQRSFRLSNEALADLNRIAEHLAKLDGRAPNQTTALAWAISRGVDAVAKIEGESRRIPLSMRSQVLEASRLLAKLNDDWEAAARVALVGGAPSDGTRSVYAKHPPRTQEDEELTKQVTIVSRPA